MKNMKKTLVFVLAALLLLSVSASWALADDCGCLEGCTQGYWKNHLDAWGPTGYTPDTLLYDAFVDNYGNHAVLPPELAGDTMMDALEYHGGPGDLGAARIMLRAATAALLNATHPGVNYPKPPLEIINNVIGGLQEGREVMICKYTWMDWYNNQYCTLSPD